MPGRDTALGRWTTFTFEPLSFPIFRAIWLASLATNFGGQIQAIAASWLMLSLDPSPATVALVQTANTAPLMLLSLLAGALADTVDRRVVMTCALSFCSLASAGLALVSAFGTLTPMSLLAFTFCIAAGIALYAPSWQASVIEMASVKILPQAVALNSLSFNAARSVGPAIGAQIVAIAGVTAAFALNALSYIGMIVVLVLWRRPKAASSGQTLFVAISDGVRFVGLSPDLMRTMAVGAVFCVGASAPLALMPVLAHALDSDPRALGALLGFFGVGSMCGALTSAQMRARFGSGRVVVLSCVGLTIAYAAIGAAPLLILVLRPSHWRAHVGPIPRRA